MTRQRLIDAAVEMFEERGYASTTVEDIADRAMVGRTTFYLHFSDKRDIAIANGDILFDGVVAVFMRLPKMVDLTDAAILQWLRSYMRFMRQHSHALIAAAEANITDRSLVAEGFSMQYGLAERLAVEFAGEGWRSISADPTTRLALLVMRTQWLLLASGAHKVQIPGRNSLAVLAEVIRIELGSTFERTT